MVKQTIKIFCRVKPTKQQTGIYSVDQDENEQKANIEFLVPRDLASGFINNKRESYNFLFQRVFDQQVKQDEIFNNVAKDVVDNVMAGFNGTIFAYGQTGSGKTFTITGGAERFSDRGIIPRCLSYIFQKYEEDKDHVYTTEISYLEIYNDNGYDLLDPRHEDVKSLEDLPKVSLMEDPDQNIHLKNLSVLPSQNEEEALNHLFLGDTNRMIAETPMNQASTRSHCIFTIHITSREPGSATIRKSKLHLVDLAGSERVAKTNVGGQQLTEAKYINLSLHFLEQVIVALSDKGRQHIPYRNSMMTSVLRDSLGGNCMTTMIATVAVDKKCLDESISTCRFAQRVALIKNEATLNEELDPKLMILRLRKEIKGLRDELELVTGEARTEQLTKEEIEMLNELLQEYIKNSDLEASLDVGGDSRKIQYCYSYLKRLANKSSDVLTACEVTSKNNNEAIEVPVNNSHHSDLSPLEIKRLKEILQQRDNEINILVNMLKKERKRAIEAESGSNLERSQVNSAPGPRAPYNSKLYESDSPSKQLPTPPMAKSRLKDIPMSVGKQEAFEIYKRDCLSNSTINDQKEILKQRYAEAKMLGAELNKYKEEMGHVKNNLEQERRKQAVRQTMTNELNDSYEESEAENQMKQQMEEVKTRYKTSFTRLKAMKAEIDHLHHLLDKSRHNMIKEFEVWWENQSSRTNNTYDNKRPPSGRNTNRGDENTSVNLPPNRLRMADAWKTPPDSPYKHNNGESHSNESTSYRTSTPKTLSPREMSINSGRNALTDIREPIVTKTRSRFAPNFSSAVSQPHVPNPATTMYQQTNTNSQIRPLSGSNIPLTGDKKTDADIMAFIQARETLLKRRGQVQQ